MKNDVNLLKVTTTDDEIKELKYKTEKREHENILKSLKIDSECYKKKYKSLNKKKIYISILEILTGIVGVSTGSALSVTGIGSSIGVPIASCTAFMASGYVNNERIFFLNLKLDIQNNLFGISLFRQMALYSFGNKKLEDVENVYQASLMYKLLSDNEENMMVVYKKELTNAMSIQQNETDYLTTLHEKGTIFVRVYLKDVFGFVNHLR